MKNGIKHVFFDLDHTLWDFDRNSKLTFEKIFELHKIDVALERFIPVYEPINLKYWKLYREERVTKPQLRYARLKEAFDAINFEIADELINMLSISYIDYLTTFNHLFDGAVEILDYLNLKYQLHIITNGFEEAQERKMKNSKIITYFKTITNSEMVGVKKPNPRIFRFALHQANAEPEESIMIGDSLEADIQGAENVGMRGIHFNALDKASSNGTPAISNLMDLKNLL